MVIQDQFLSATFCFSQWSKLCVFTTRFCYYHQIRLQLETLLAEKARLAHENSIYARENRFLREIVEYHQLTMQDVVYLDEGIEEVTEVHHFPSEPIDDTCSPSSSFINIPTPPPLPPASHTPHTVNKSSSPDSIVPSQPPVVKEIPVSSSPKNSDS